MPAKVLLPAFSSEMTEATLTKWLKKEGETVAVGDILVEVKTDKATLKIEAVEDGVLSRILIPEGTQNVPVNSPIGLIREDEEDESAPEEVTSPDANMADERTEHFGEEIDSQIQTAWTKAFNDAIELGATPEQATNFADTKRNVHLVLLSVGKNRKDVCQAIDELVKESSDFIYQFFLDDEKEDPEYVGWNDMSTWDDMTGETTVDTLTTGIGNFFREDDKTIPTHLAVYGYPSEICFAKTHVEILEKLGAKVEIRVGRLDRYVVILESIWGNEKTFLDALASIWDGYRYTKKPSRWKMRYKVAAHLCRYKRVFGSTDVVGIDEYPNWSSDRLGELEHSIPNTWVRLVMLLRKRMDMLGRWSESAYLAETDQYEAERMKEILEEAGATVKLQEQLRTAEETAIVEDWNNISTLKKCPECDKQVSREAKDCPHCGHPLFRYDYKALFLRLLKLVMIILILWFIVIPVGWWLIKFVFKFMFIDVITG